MKHGTYVPRNNMHVYTKSHNSAFNIYSVMPLFGLFGLINLYETFNLAHNSKTSQHFQRNLVHNILGTICMCIPSHITLNCFYNYSGITLFIKNGQALALAPRHSCFVFANMFSTLLNCYIFIYIKRYFTFMSNIRDQS